MAIRPVPPPIETAMLDSVGLVTPPWANFFNNMYKFHVGEYVVASGVTLNNGTTAAGVLSDLQTLLDGNTYHIVEAAGIPGIDLEISFTGVKSISAIIVSAYYVGSATHAVRIQLYNYSTTMWDTMHTLMDGLDYEQHFKTIADDTNYISGGAAIVRLYHTETGNASHDLYIDYVGLKS